MCSTSTQIPNDKNHEVCYHGNRFFFLKAMNFTTIPNFSPSTLSHGALALCKREESLEIWEWTIHAYRVYFCISSPINFASYNISTLLWKSVRTTVPTKPLEAWQALLKGSRVIFSQLKSVFAHMQREQCHHATIPRVSSRQDPRRSSENDCIL